MQSDSEIFDMLRMTDDIPRKSCSSPHSDPTDLVTMGTPDADMIHIRVPVNENSKCIKRKKKLDVLVTGPLQKQRETRTARKVDSATAKGDWTM